MYQFMQISVFFSTQNKTNGKATVRHKNEKDTGQNFENKHQFDLKFWILQMALNNQLKENLDT